MLVYNRDNFKLEIQSKEDMQIFEDLGGKEVYRFIKRTTLNVHVFDIDCSTCAFEVITFVKSALTTFSYNKFGKSIDRMELLNDIDKNFVASNDFHQKVLIVRKKKDNDEIVLVFELVDENNQVLRIQVLNYRACEQLKEALIKALYYLSPDEYLSYEEINKKKEEHKKMMIEVNEREKERRWNDFSKEYKKDLLNSYIKHVKSNYSITGEENDSVIPTIVFKMNIGLRGRMGVHGK